MLDWNWLHRNLADIARLAGVHVALSVIPVAVALIISLPVGYLVSRTKLAANGLLIALGLLYSIPSLALFVAMPAFLGTKTLDPQNIVVALSIYAFALLVRSVVDGLRAVPEPVRQSASAVGYGGWRRLVKVELPLAMPVIFAGLRVATVSNIALVSISVIVGQPSLGTLFEQGFQQAFYTPIIVGLVLSVVLALLIDALILAIQRGALPWRRTVRA
ncbi:MAG: ABC transporter permease [Propionibacteriaceae bacterium]